MYISDLQLTGFRNYERKEFLFDREKLLTIFVGNNGAGKTNILEAIYLLGCASSFRTTRNENLIRSAEEFSRVEGKIVSDVDEEHGVEIFFQNNPRKSVFKWDSVALSAGALFGRVPVVVFLPEDLALFTDAPAKRRRFLDMIFSRVSRKYFEALTHYQKALSARNALLIAGKERAVPLEEFTFWEEKLIAYGKFLIEERKKGIAFFNEILAKIFNNISKTQSQIGLEYRSSVSALSRYGELFEERKSFDFARLQTSIGPHRDDFSVLLNGKNAITGSSRGEMRTILLALKLAELNFITDVLHERPIFLLDDVFSELDATHRYGLLERIGVYQTMITTVEPFYFKDFQGNYRVQAVGN